MAGFNPFAPNAPVPPGRFVGRQTELRQLTSCLVQTREGAPRNFMLTGERGIGKSSLLTYVKHVAKGFEVVNGETLGFLVIDTAIASATTAFGLIKKIEHRMKEELSKGERARSVLSEIWGFVQRVEAAGVRIRPEDKAQSEELLLEQFTSSLASLESRVCDADNAAATFGRTYDGILLLIDEADNASPELHLGSFSKLLMEGLQARACNRVMIGLAGLPGLPSVLVSSHVSSVRIFEELPLGLLSKKEVGEIIDLCLRIASEKNPTPTRITERAAELLIELSEGYPHFIQQFGYSAFDADTDQLIDEKDVTEGAFGRLGAVESIGNRYYRQDYAQIPERGCRDVLRIMAGRLDAWITLSEIAQEYPTQPEELADAIKLLLERKAIVSKEGASDVFRLQQKGFGYWLRMIDERRERDPDEDRGE